MKEKFQKNNHPMNQINLTFGQKSADRLARIAGSWTFIITFFSFLLAWIILNSIWFSIGRSWDPYPFILLNLILSCIASLQAPIILMSQNRTEEKDCQRAEYDYAVNRKAEREIEEIRKQLDRIEMKIKKI